MLVIQRVFQVSLVTRIPNLTLEFRYLCYKTEWFAEGSCNKFLLKGYILKVPPKKWFCTPKKLITRSLYNAFQCSFQYFFFLCIKRRISQSFRIPWAPVSICKHAHQSLSFSGYNSVYKTRQLCWMRSSELWRRIQIKPAFLLFFVVACLFVCLGRKLQLSELGS